ncbi:MAG: site-specific integrase [Mucinivorans sp.]
MERKLFSVLFFIKRTKLRKNGEAPIVVRITHGKQSAEVQISRTVPVGQWSQTKCCSTGKSKQASETNAFIEMIRVKLYKIHQEMERQGGFYNVNTIKDAFMGKGVHERTLYSIFKEHNDRCRELVGVDYELITIRRYDNCLKYLMETVRTQYKKEDILLCEINAELVRNFEFYLKTERGCTQNTVIRYMKCFKKIIHLAISNEWMSRNPFAGIKFHEAPVNKEFLTQDEIATLLQKELHIEKLNLVRDIFAFQIFTGLAYIDVYNLRSEHIFSDNNGKMWIRKTREKTSNMCNIPLLAIPQMLLEKYATHPECEKRGALLPVLCNQITT